MGITRLDCVNETIYVANPKILPTIIADEDDTVKACYEFKGAN
jgi:hypothetical protein